jgi:hypothetical protein
MPNPDALFQAMASSLVRRLDCLFIVGIGCEPAMNSDKGVIVQEQNNSEKA